jgi:CRP-like cAMP-binding protein
LLDARKILDAAGLPDPESAALRSLFAAEPIARGGYFIREGEASLRFAIVEKGLFRSFYIDEEGRDFTKHFFAEGSILFAYAARARRAPCAYSVQAIEDSAISVAGIEELGKAVGGSQALQRLAKDLLDSVMMDKERRSSELAMLESADRYRRFLEENPGLEGRVRQHQLASYLGITAVSLSRLRRRLSVNKR